MKRRPWLAGLIAFVLVVGIGGMAVAAQSILVDEPEPEPGLVADGTDIEYAIDEPTKDDKPEADPVKDEVVKDEKPDEEPVKVEKDEPVSEEKDEPAGDDKDEPVSEEKDDPVGDVTPPELVITYPEDGAVVDTKTITFTGEVEPGSEVIAAGYEADVDAAGNWSIKLILSPGGNTATFYAYDTAGNKAIASVKVTYEAPDDDPKDDEPSDVAFTAHQKYGSCSDSYPYDVFHGTATPGTVVWIGSEYGSAETVADAKGFWEKKVRFYEASPDVPFVVVVEAGDDRAEFDFVWDPAPVEFTVDLWNEASDSPEPYAKFYGTAEPGTVIVATSDYGSADMVTEGSDWHLKVWLTGAPDGEPFPITVTADGFSDTFYFVVYVAGDK
ncbi:MAG: hypothetical protein KJO84_04010 [Acidimicrobiia bacterium]|nr:hypothetical protein [Acidimicrobiia bacterium]